MAATKYQVLYRCSNETMGVPITNDASSKYEPTFEFYVEGDHRIFSTDANVQAEEMQKQQEMISYANQASNPKHDMLFVYDGCEKINHQQWIEDQVGYVVRNWQAVRSKIGNRGDFSKDFTCLNAETPEDGATVVCTKKVFESYLSAGTHTFCLAGDFTSEEVQKLMDDDTIFAFEFPNWKDHATLSNNSVSIWSASYYNSTYGHLNGTVIATHYYGPVYVDDSVKESVVTGYWQGSRVSKEYTIRANGENVYLPISYTREDIETTTIPGHYEDSLDAPYAVKDQYRRINSSPWLVNCTVGSLEAALIKAKKLIEMIGLENVKVVKLVAIDQFVKIQ